MPRSSSNRELVSLSTNDFDLRFHARRPAARRDGSSAGPPTC